MRHRLLDELEENLKALSSTSPQRREILLTWKDIKEAFNLNKLQLHHLRYHSRDFPKPPTFRAAIENWYRRKKRVTARQREALKLRSEGLTTRAIAKIMGVSQKRVVILCQKGKENEYI